MPKNVLSAERALERAMDTEMISAEQLRILCAANLPNVVLLDIRSEEELDQGVIHGSVMLPCDHDTENPENTAIFSKSFHANFNPEKFNPNDKYVLICRTGHRVAIALDTFLKHNLLSCELLGGIIEWNRLGFPLEKVVVQTFDTRHTPEKRLPPCI